VGYATDGNCKVQRNYMDHRLARWEMAEATSFMHAITGRYSVEIEYQSRPGIGPSRPGNEISKELISLKRQ